MGVRKTRTVEICDFLFDVQQMSSIVNEFANLDYAPAYYRARSNSWASGRPQNVNVHNPRARRSLHIVALVNMYENKQIENIRVLKKNQYEKIREMLFEFFFQF